MADNEIADANGNSWYDQAKKQEAQEESAEVEESLRYQHISGLRRLLVEAQEAGEDWRASIVQRMISEREKLEVDKQVLKQRDKQALEKYGYKSIKEAKAAGWVEDRPQYMSGEQIELARHILVRNFRRLSARRPGKEKDIDSSLSREVGRSWRRTLWQQIRCVRIISDGGTCTHATTAKKMQTVQAVIFLCMGWMLPRLPRQQQRASTISPRMD